MNLVCVMLILALMVMVFVIDPLLPMISRPPALLEEGARVGSESDG